MSRDELLKEMRAMWDAILNAGFGVDNMDDLPRERFSDAVSAWRDEIAEHPEAEAMEELIGKELDCLGAFN